MNVFGSDLILLHAPSVYDFRRKAILYGPISDVIPSSPIFEMYPIGFSSLLEYLHQRGMRVRIINLAYLMLTQKNFDAEQLIQKLQCTAFGIDLHWLPHAQGSLEIAALCKKHHPEIPVAGRHGRGNGIGFTFFEQDDGPFPGPQDLFLFGLYQGERADRSRVGGHQGQGFFLPVFPLPEQDHRLFLPWED